MFYIYFLLIDSSINVGLGKKTGNELDYLNFDNELNLIMPYI